MKYDQQNQKMTTSRCSNRGLISSFVYMDWCTDIWWERPWRDDARFMRKKSILREGEKSPVGGYEGGGSGWLSTTRFLEALQILSSSRDTSPTCASQLPRFHSNLDGAFNYYLPCYLVMEAFLSSISASAFVEPIHKAGVEAEKPCIARIS